MRIGIWNLEDGVIECSRQNQSPSYIKGQDVWVRRTYQNLEVWDMVIHIAEKDWSSLDDCRDLLSIMEYLREKNNIEVTEEAIEIDNNSLELARGLCLQY